MLRPPVEGIPLSTIKLRRQVEDREEMIPRNRISAMCIKYSVRGRDLGQHGEEAIAQGQ